MNRTRNIFIGIVAAAILIVVVSLLLTNSGGGATPGGLTVERPATVTVRILTARRAQ